MSNDEYMDGGVDRSSEEASNDRGAKDRQIVIAIERNLCLHKQKAEIIRPRNSTA